MNELRKRLRRRASPSISDAQCERIVDLPRPATAATVLSSLEIENAPVIYLAVKSWCLVFLGCGIVAFGGCATDEEFNAAEAKTGEAVPGEVNPNAPGASQQQVRTQPGFNF
jgi:hypothetical protein